MQRQRATDLTTFSRRQDSRKNCLEKFASLGGWISLAYRRNGGGVSEITLYLGTPVHRDYCSPLCIRFFLCVRSSCPVSCVGQRRFLQSRYRGAGTMNLPCRRKKPAQNPSL